MSGTGAREEIVRLDAVNKVFGPGERGTMAARDVTLSAHRGELVVMLGPSGSGKTTLLTLMAGLLSPSSGEVRLYGAPVEGYSPRALQHLRARRVGFVFQTFLLLDPLTVRENVTLVLRFAGTGRTEAEKRAGELLERLGIRHLAEKFPPTLSQGEKQRTAVARAFANRPGLILADEPTASLETRQGQEIIHLLHGYAKQEDGCVIVATHDQRIAGLADRVLQLKDGAVQGD